MIDPNIQYFEPAKPVPDAFEVVVDRDAIRQEVCRRGAELRESQAAQKQEGKPDER